MHVDLSDLTGDGHRELVDDLKVARHLVVDDIALVVRPELVEPHLVTFPQPVPAADLLAVGGVGTPITWTSAIAGCV